MGHKFGGGGGCSGKCSHNMCRVSGKGGRLSREESGENYCAAVHKRLFSICDHFRENVMEIADAERRDIDIERRTKRIAHAVQELADGPEWEAISELEAKRNTAEKKDTYIKLTPVKICLSNLRSRSDSILNAPRKNFLGTTIGLQKGIGDAYKTSSFLAQDCMDCSSNAESEECAWEAHKAITASILRVQHGINILFNIVRPATRDKIMVHVRWMIRRDMPEVLGIEESSWGLPWSEEDFIRCLRRRNCIGMVAEYDERVVGFMLYELHKNRLHILNLVSSPYFRRRGVGTSMVNKLADKPIDPTHQCAIPA